MKHNGRNIITSNDITLSSGINSGETLDKVLDQLTETLEELKSNVKWLYKYGGVGGGGGKGGSSQDWGIICRLLNVLVTDTTKEIYYESPGSKSLYIKINNPNGDTFILNYQCGGIKERTKLDLDCSWTYNSNIQLLTNGTLSIEITDGNLVTKTLDVDYIVNAYTIDVNLVTESGNKLQPLSGIYTAFIEEVNNNKLYLDVQIKSNINKDNILIKFNDFIGEIHEINTNLQKNLIYTLDRVNLFQDRVLTDLDSGNYKCNVLFFIDNIDEPTKEYTLNIDIIPSGLYLIVVPSQGLIYKENNIQNPYQYYPGNIGLLLTPYYGLYNQNRNISCEIYLDDEYNNTLSLIERTSQISTIKILEVGKTGIHKLSFKLIYGNEESELVNYYVYLKNFEETVDWFKNVDVESFNFKDNVINEYHDLKIGNNVINNIITKYSNDTSNTYIDLDNPSSVINEYSNYDCMYSFAILYNDTNDDLNPILSFSNDTGNFKLTIYQDSLQLLEQGTTEDEGSSTNECDLFIPKTSSFNSTILQNYYLITIIKHCIESIGNNKKFEYSVYINGCLEGTLGTYITSLINIKKIIIYPGNFYFNLLDIAYITSGSITDSLVVRYWYAYQYYIQDIKDNISKKIEILSCFEKENASDPIPFEYTKEGRIMIPDISVLNNFVSKVDIPVMCVLYLDSNVNSSKLKRRFIDWSELIRKANEEPTDEDRVNVGVYWAPAEKGDRFEFIDLSGSNLINTNNIPISNDQTLKSSFILEILGSTTREYRAKNYTLKLAEDEDSYYIPVYSPNYNQDDDSTFLYEQAFTLKADVVDSSHCNNTSIGKFINTVSKPFNGPQLWLSNRYKSKIKNCLEGFPFLLFARQTIENKDYIYYLGIYNFNLGRSSILNLGYCNTTSLDLPQPIGNNGFSITTISKNMYKEMSSFTAAEILDNDATFDFSQFDNSILFKLTGVKTDAKYMFGDIVSGELDTDTIKSLILNFVRRTSNAGYYIFNTLSKGFHSEEKVPNLGYNTKRYVPNAQILYKRSIDVNSDFIYQAVEQPNYNPSQIDLQNYLYIHNETGDQNTPPYVDYLSLLEYYLICMAFGLLDSVLKNLNIKSWNNGKTFYIAFYDMDTSLGVDNDGFDATYYAFSDYWENREQIVENLEYDCVIDTIVIWRDYAPNKDEQNLSGDVLYDVPSSYLFAIPKYSKCILLNMEYDSPQDLWDKWRNVEGHLRNALYFIDTYYKGYMNGVDELMFNYNYRAKYFKQDSNKFNDEIKRFKGRRIYKVKNWLDRRFHMMDAYMNLAGSSSLISDGANFDINDTSKYYFESTPIKLLSKDNPDVYVNKHIFSESRSFANNATDFVIKAPDYTPLILSSSKGTYKFLLRDKTKKYKIVTNNVGNTKFTFGGSTEWTYLNSINAIADGTPLSINSNKLTLLNGDSGSINGFTIVMPALKDIVLTSSGYKGSLDLSKDSLTNTVNFPNINSINIKNSLISLQVNGEHVKSIDLSGINSSEIILLNCDALENVIFNRSKIGRCIINPLWTETLSLTNNSIQTLELTANAKFSNSSITIRNDTKIESITLNDFKSVTISGCTKLKTLIISGEKLNTLSVTNCSLLDSVSINATNATSISLPSTKLSTKLELITKNDSFNLNTLNISNSQIKKINYTINLLSFVEDSNIINLIPLKNCNTINLLSCNLVEYIKVPNDENNSFRITNTITFNKCSNLKRIYGNISIERSDAFSECNNFSIHGSDLLNVLFNGENVYDNEIVRRGVIFDLNDNIIFLEGDNVTNIDTERSSSLSYSFNQTKCTLFDVYYAFAIAKNVTNALYAFSRITNLFVDPNIDIDLFKNSTKITNLNFAFGYNSNSKRINLRGGLFSNFINTSVNLSGIFYAKSYCAETSLFNNEHNTKFNIYRFSPDFIADSLSNITGSESKTQLIYIILNCIDLNGNASSDINHYGNVSNIVSNMESGKSYYSVLSECVYINYDTLHNIPGLRFDSCFNSTFGTGIIRKASEIFLEKTNVVSITNCFRISGNSDYLRINTYGKVILNIDSDFFEGMSSLLYVGYDSLESTLDSSINYPGISYYTFSTDSFLTSNINGLNSLGNVSYNSGFSCSYNGNNLRKIITSNSEFPYSILDSCRNIKMFAGFFANSTISDDSTIDLTKIKLPNSMFYNTPNLTNCIGLFSGVDFAYSLSSEGFKNCNNLSRVDFLFSGSVSDLSKNSNMTGQIPKKLFYHGHILASKTIYGFNGTLETEDIVDALNRIIGTKTIITKANSLTYYITTIELEIKWYNSNDEEVLLQDVLDNYTIEQYPIYNNKITSMIGCFVNNHRTPYINSDPLPEVNPLYNSFDYVYNNGVFEQKEKNLYEYLITWEYDGVNNNDDYYNIDNIRSVNYCCAPDLLRYCSNNCLINELFAYSGESVGRSNASSYGRQGNNEYGISGRIPPQLLYPFSDSEEIFNLSGMFKHCTRLSSYNYGQGTSNYIIPEDFFKNGPAKIGNLMLTFLGIYIPGNCDLDVFKYIKEKTSLNNICKIFYKASYGSSSNSSQININNIFLGFDNISNMVAAFAGKNSSNDESAFLSSITSNILFNSVFSNNIYNLNIYMNNGFYSYVFAYLNSSKTTHESDKTVYYDSNDTNKNYIN